MLGAALFIFSSFVHISQCGDFHTSLIIDKLEDCPEENITKYFNMTNVVINIVDEHTFVNGQIIFTGEMPGEHSVKVVAIAEKCKHRTLQATCEIIFDFAVVKNLCTIWNEKGRMWSKSLESISPPLECRMKNNIYTVTNGTIDEDIFRKTVPEAEKYYWKLKLKLFFNNELRACGKLACGFQKFPGKKVKKH
ncbi:uncharacterized protein LOC106667044 isoform X1 [Cimex lectularius]|uniref:Uncharacterized protein n=1 Tax=Cimex lectularius TaxID=79782 RepID=A0A8I6RSE2_CIMLE|nr:uncharacterized protein LOC106667044 isoform X1 [Cimex lectularius]